MRQKADQQLEEELTADERETPDEGALVAAACAGDQEAFRSLYRLYAPVVGRRLRRILGRTQDAEDVLQMVFMETHRSLARFDRTRPFGPWLHGISVRVTGTFLRSRQRRWWQIGRDDVDTVGLSSSSDDGSPEQEAMVSEVAREVWRELQRVAPDKRIAFVLFEIEQRSLGEIAELMGTSPQTIWARIASAKAQIKKRLERQARRGVKR